MNALSVQEIEALRVLLLENARELLGESELLFQHKKFARAYTLAHLSSEELAKLLTLASIGVSLVNGSTINWKKLDEKLCSHKAKLKGLLFVDFLGKAINPTAQSIVVNQKKRSRVELLNELKNASLYAGVYQGDLYKPSAVITEECASSMLVTARNRLELYSEIEAITHGRIVELATHPMYIKALNMLGAADAL